MATPGALMRLTVEVLPLAEENSHGLHREDALAAFKGRKFALPVRLDDTLGDVWGQIVERYTQNYLDAAQASHITIKVLQDSYDCDLDLRDTVGDIFTGETDPARRMIKVVPSFVYRDFSVPPTSHLRPANVQKRQLEAPTDSANKRRRLENGTQDIARHQDRPIPTTETDYHDTDHAEALGAEAVQTNGDIGLSRSSSIVQTGNAETGREEFGRGMKEESPELGLSTMRTIPESDQASPPSPMNFLQTTQAMGSRQLSPLEENERVPSPTPLASSRLATAEPPVNGASHEMQAAVLEHVRRVSQSPATFSQLPSAQGPVGSAPEDEQQAAEESAKGGADQQRVTVGQSALRGHEEQDAVEESAPSVYDEEHAGEEHTVEEPARETSSEHVNRQHTHSEDRRIQQSPMSSRSSSPEPAQPVARRNPALRKDIYEPSPTPDFMQKPTKPTRTYDRNGLGTNGVVSPTGGSQIALLGEKQATPVNGRTSTPRNDGTPALRSCLKKPSQKFYTMPPPKPRASITPRKSQSATPAKSTSATPIKSPVTFKETPSVASKATPTAAPKATPSSAPKRTPSSTLYESAADKLRRIRENAASQKRARSVSQAPTPQPLQQSKVPSRSPSAPTPQRNKSVTPPMSAQKEVDVPNSQDSALPTQSSNDMVTEDAPEAPREQSQSPQQDRRPARFLSHSPTPSHSSASDSDSDAESVASPQKSPRQSPSPSPSPSDSDDSDEETEDEEPIPTAPAPAPVPATRISESPMKPNTTPASKLFPSTQPAPSVKKTPVPLPVPRSSFPLSASQPQSKSRPSISASQPQTRRSYQFPTVQEQLKAVHSAPVSVVKKRGFDPASQSLGGLVKSKGSRVSASQALLDASDDDDETSDDSD